MLGHRGLRIEKHRVNSSSVTPFVYVDMPIIYGELNLLKQHAPSRVSLTLNLRMCLWQC
jgi:hypothetical protein